MQSVEVKTNKAPFYDEIWYSGSYTSKTDHIDITEILLKVALNTTSLTLIMIYDSIFAMF
jgi:hypothetical protein